MKNVLSINTLKQHKASLLVLALSIAYLGTSSASRTTTSTNNGAAFKNGYNWIDSVIHGDLGTLLSAICFIVALIIGIAKQSAMVVVGGFIFALLIAFGPDMVTGIVNSSQVIDSANMVSSTSSYSVESTIVMICALCFWYLSRNNTTQNQHNQLSQMAI